jgi:LysM repeat protein
VHAYRVKPGDTLWSIAAANYAGDTRKGVWQLQQRNHLGGTTLTPGQRLLLP